MAPTTIGAYVGLSVRALTRINHLQVSPDHARRVAELDDADQRGPLALTTFVDSLINIGITAVNDSVANEQRHRVPLPSRQAPVNTPPDQSPPPTEPGATPTATVPPPLPLPTDGLWTIEHVAAFLQLSPKTIYNWRVHGKGPKPTTVGGQLRWRREDVERWVAEQQE